MKSYSVLFRQYLRGLIILTFIGGTLLLNACAASAGYNKAKMDTELNQKITRLEKENPDSIIQFTGKTKGEINDQMKAQLEETGVTVETVAGDIFTANGGTESIKKVTLLEFVVYLENVKKLDLK